METFIWAGKEDLFGDKEEMIKKLRTREAIVAFVTAAFKERHQTLA